MATTGLDVWDKTIQTTNAWLMDVMEETGADRRLAWHALGAVLRTMRERIPPELAAHLGAQLPLLVRGAYYDQHRPSRRPDDYRSLAEFQERVAAQMREAKPVDTRLAILGVFLTLERHVEAGQLDKVIDALPFEVRALWPSRDGGSAREPARDPTARPA